MGSTTRGAASSEPSECDTGSKPAGEALEARREAAGRALAGGLYLVATPIGNLGDLTVRALDTLRAVDLIACEDTRVTAKLLAAYGISTPMKPYHEHNAERMRPQLLERLRAGARIALVSDAGTPLVSDPGYKLVRAAIAAGVRVGAVPGASAALAALSVSGLPTDRFLFAGFLPHKAVQRRKTLTELAAVPATLVLFETPPRLADSLGDMAELLGTREAAVCRELTKLHEEVRRGTLAELAAHYRAAGAPRGELVLVVGAPAAPAPPDDRSLDALLEAALERGSLRDATAEIAAATGLPRRRIYARALALARARGGEW